ncbi:MAG: TonB family protein [Parvularcula sp.]
MNEKNAGVVPLDEERRRRQLKADSAGRVDDLQNLDSAGAMLAAARQARGLSIEEVGARTNITPERVAALEAMQLEALPSAPFTLGFVRTYATLLDLPVDPLVDRFRDEAGYPGAAYVPRLSPKLDRDLGPPPQVSLFAVMVVICVIGYVVWQILQSVASDEAVAPPEGFPQALNEDTDTPVVYEAEASLVENPAVAPAEEQPEAADASSDVSSDGEAVPDSDDGLTEIERLQRSIKPDDPMVLVESPQLPRVKPTPEELARAAEARRLAALEAAQRAAEQASQEASLGGVSADGLSENGEDGTSDGGPAEAVADGMGEAQDPSSVRASSDVSQQDMADTDNQGPPSASAAPPADTVAAPAVEESPEAAIVPPVRTLVVPPVYPVRCESGASDREVVTVSYRVSRFGKVVGPTIAESTNTCFNRAALAAIARWNFSPAQSDGKAVASEMQSTRIVFRRPE